MEQKKTKLPIWNAAAPAGLVLGGISSIYIFITQGLALLTTIPAYVSLPLNFIIWLVKFILCIYLMRYYMLKFVSNHSNATNKDTFLLGITIAILSATLFSAVSMANVAFISHDTMMASIDAVAAMVPMDKNTTLALDMLKSNLPQYTFFSNLIYAFLYGTILSAILSRNIPSRDPFADYKPKKEE